MRSFSLIRFAARFFVVGVLGVFLLANPHDTRETHEYGRCVSAGPAELSFINDMPEIVQRFLPPIEHHDVFFQEGTEWSYDGSNSINKGL